ncbi:BTAD domain-containing putative transcriptional regulator [Streptomyces sp. NPDC005813]|uniref:AfsR/SARP family transcriptional regulator n=1 Tax=Streptomyces sp. NPDC005813 TaxID=3155592 RepID=UPI0033BFDB2E
MDATVRYSILGTVRALRGDTEVDFGPPKRLALLSLLVLRAPGPVSPSDAVDVLWDGEPPASAVNVVHRHIGALRRILEPGLRSRTDAEHLARASDGYRLQVDPSTSDLLRFRDLRSQAQLALKDGDPTRAAQVFVEALGLWRSPMVAEGTSVARHPAFTSVGHEYVTTVKEAADVVLTSAPALTEEVLSALRRAVERHPFDEALHARIISVLATTGRQAEALAQFEAVRRTLADELGVEPGPGLRAARQHLVRGRSSGCADRPTGPADAVRAPVHLPPESVYFAGRQKALKQFLELVPPESENESAASTVVLCGMAGVGKTALSLRWAHSAADRFPDGQVHVDLQGYHSSQQPLDAARAMRTVLDALGVSRSEVRDDTALHSVYRRALAGRRLLIVLDDVRDCEQVRPLLPTDPGCLAIVTSRRRLEGLAVTHDAHILTLDPMTVPEGLQLLERRLGPERIRAERGSAEEIVELCGGLPLALAVAGTRALSRPPGFSLASLAAQLRGGLVALSSQDAPTDVRSAFRRSYEGLTAGAARLLRLLSLHPARDITLSAAASLAGTDLCTTMEDLAELADHHLLVEPTPDRYACHDLLRAWAGELSSTLDAVSVRFQARARMFEHYLYSADAATALLAPERRTVILPPPRPGVRPQTFYDRSDAAEWIIAERKLLPALVQDTRLSPQRETLRRQLTRTLDMPPRPRRR